MESKKREQIVKETKYGKKFSFFFSNKLTNPDIKAETIIIKNERSTLIVPGILKPRSPAIDKFNLKRIGKKGRYWKIK
jgi:hypothetical protein